MTTSAYVVTPSLEAPKGVLWVRHLYLAPPAERVNSLCGLAFHRADAQPLERHFGAQVADCSSCSRSYRKRTGEAPCRVCGCTNDRACDGGCYWSQPDLCSSCAYLRRGGSR